MQPFIKTLTVKVDSGSYPIYIGSQLLSQHELLNSTLKQASCVVIITNEKINHYYGIQLFDTLSKHATARVEKVLIKEGESFKNAATLAEIHNALFDLNLDRESLLIALGGGVIGDLVGFAAATFMRGIPFIQIPTTLLAQVDSSIGGKTGINHPAGKNMIGAFHQPQTVFSDIDTLNSLPSREISAGMAELIKAAIIADYHFFEWLELNISYVMQKKKAYLIEAIERACQIKADVVTSDEKEQGLRAILNFGHTFGHAIEKGLGYGDWLHGEAVACGMVMAAKLSKKIGLISGNDVIRITNILSKASLPIKPPKWSASRYIELMRQDKKSVDGQLKLILLQTLGSAKTDFTDEALIAETINECNEE